LDANNIKEMLLAAVIGDALGTPFDGLTKGHLSAVFGRIDGYTDPEPALRHHMENWKKPALYSSLSQFLLIMVMSVRENRRNLSGGIISSFEKAMASGNRESGIFRHTGKAEKMLFMRLGNPDEVRELRSPSPACTRVPVMVAAAAAASGHLSLPELLSMTGIFTAHVDTAAAALVLYRTLWAVMGEGGTRSGNPVDIALQAAESAREDFVKNPASAFNAGINPDTLVASLERYGAVFSALAGARDRDAAERAIITIVNTTLKTPVTRATVNNPLCLVPYAVFISASAGDTSEALLSAAMEGGSTAPLCALTGALAGAGGGTGMSAAELLSNLINRKKIIALTDGIAGGSLPASALREFIEAEVSLSAKEDDERAARLKHATVKQKTKPSRRDLEEKLARHAVESWTKLDKARWKKEKKKSDRNE
jgi:hypothetical protein